MGVPTANNLMTLDYAFQGLPFCSFDVTGTLNVQTLDVAYRGLPYSPVSPSDPPLLQYPARQTSLGRFIRAKGRGIKIQHLR